MSTAMERPTHTHNRSKSSFSFRSNKSDKSDPTRPRPEVTDLHETEKERQKARFKVQTNRDPNKAIRDATPADRQMEANTLPPLRSTQHKDWKGEVITDADASNPTRHRMERPLDTIRSFEAAIDNEWKRKAQASRPESADVTAYSSRRNSFAGGPEPPNGNRHSTPVGAYHGSRNPHRYSDHHVQRPGNPRYQSSPMAPQHHGNYNGLPQHGHTQSYDTVETGGSYGTSASEYWTNSTDPSSENSSIERMYGGNGFKPEHQDAYGGQYRHDAIQEEYDYDGDGYGQNQSPVSPLPPAPSHYYNQYSPSRPNPGYAAPSSTLPPPPPAHQSARNPIPLGLGPGSSGPAPPQRGKLQQRPPLQQQNSSGDGKRKSWLKRRFSKNS